MKDVFFSIDQQLGNKLFESLNYPIKIDVMNPKYFDHTQNNEFFDNNDFEINSLENDIFEASIESLDYAIQRDEIINDNFDEDELLYNIAKTAVDSFLEANESERENDDQVVSQEYSIEQQKSLWDRIKKYSHKASNWLKKQLKRSIKIKSIKLERFDVTVNKKPSVIITNPIKIDNLNLNINYRITVKYEILRIGGRISLSDNFRMPNTDFDIRFTVNDLKYFALPYFRELKIVKYIAGFKVTIGLASLVNRIIKPMEIFDASKYLPEIPWFEKTYTPEPPLGISTYNNGLSFGVSFKIKE